MAKVVGLSGTQGGGKSTLLLGLKENGWALDTFRVSRAVQEELGWKTLDNVMSSVQMMQQFQEEIFKQKYAHDLELRQSGGDTLHLTERTFADICAYTTHWTWELHYQGQWLLADASRWLSNYTSKCVEAQAECYGGVMLLPLMSNVVWENDPNRAKRNSAETIYESIERFTQRPEFLTQKKLTITAKSVQDRISHCHNFLETI